MRVPGEVEGDGEALAAAVAAGEVLAAGEGDAFFFAASAVDAMARLRTMIEEMPEANRVRFIQFFVCYFLRFVGLLKRGGSFTRLV